MIAKSGHPRPWSVLIALLIVAVLAGAFTDRLWRWAGGWNLWGGEQ